MNLGDVVARSQRRSTSIVSRHEHSIPGVIHMLHRMYRNQTMYQNVM